MRVRFCLHACANCMCTCVMKNFRGFMKESGAFFPFFFVCGGGALAVRAANGPSSRWSPETLVSYRNLDGSRVSRLVVLSDSSLKPRISIKSYFESGRDSPWCPCRKSSRMKGVSRRAGV